MSILLFSIQKIKHDNFLYFIESASFHAVNIGCFSKKYLDSAIKFLFSDNSNVKTHFTYYGRSKFAVIRKMLSYELRKKYRKDFINKNLIRKIENGKPFIYFSLHTQQERSTLIHAPLFVNQTQVIAKIADSLPTRICLSKLIFNVFFFRPDNGPKMRILYRKIIRSYGFANPYTICNQRHRVSCFYVLFRLREPHSVMK